MNYFTYSNKLKGVGYTNVVLLLVNVLLIGLAFHQNRSIDLAREELIIRLEPDLRSGVVRNAWEVPNTFVYSFALTIVQKINTWQENGSDDYGNNILLLQNYITPNCRSFLMKDLEQKGKAGQLQGRSRLMMEVSGIGFNEENSVRMVSRGAWDVDLSLSLQEYINNKRVKKKDVFWPIRVVEFNIDPELNRQGLALDCFYKQPSVLKDHKI